MIQIDASWDDHGFAGAQVRTWQWQCKLQPKRPHPIRYRQCERPKMPVTWMKHPQKNTIESKKQKQCHWNGIENILRAYVSGVHWWRDIYILKKKSAKFWISDYLLVEIFSSVKLWTQGSKVQELDEKLCKHSREHWLGLDCLQELCMFFFLPQKVTLF